MPRGALPFVRTRHAVRRLSVLTAWALVASVLSVVGALTQSTLTAADRPASAAPGDIEGIDVASFQHPGNRAIDWPTVASSGVRFAVVKATEGPGGAACNGSTYTNPWFRQDFTEAGAAGLYRGAYHFARPQLPISTATTQAAQYVALTGSMNGARDLPPVLDLEESCGLNATDLIAWTRTWLSEVTRMTGRVPMIYSGPYFWRTAMADTHWFSDAGYRLWLANYSVAAPSIPGGWSAYTMWQFTSSAQIPGIVGNVDRNRLGGDESLLRALGGSAPTQAVTLADGAGRDGRQTVLTRRADNTLWEKRQVAPNRDWGPWTKAADGIVGTPLLAPNADGRLEEYAVSVFGVLIHRWQLSVGGPWSSWAVLATAMSGRPLAITANPDGRLELFATTYDGRVGHTWQQWPNGAWAPWEAIGPIAGAPNLPTGPLGASANPDGRLEVFGVQANGDLGHSWQLWPGGPWSGWWRLDRGADTGSALAIAVNGDGRLEIFATIAGGQLAHSWQTPGNQTGWSGLIGMGTPVAGAAVAVNVDAAKRIVIRAPGSSTLTGRAIRMFQDPTSAGGWARANSDGASLVGPMVLGRNADDRLELFAVSLNGDVVHSWEPVAGTGPGNWSGWISL